MERVDRSGEFIRGALVLTAAAVITKILSAVYRVPFQNIVGDVGFYIYQQVYPFYGIVLALATYGFPVVISKLYAEQISLNKWHGARHVLAVSSIILLFVSIGGFSLLFGSANFLAERMKDPYLADPIRTVSFVFLLLAPISILRGYFQGRNDMVPTAISQIGEQLIRVLTILLLAILLVRQNESLYSIGSSAFLGSLAGGLMAIVLLSLFFVKRNANLKKTLWGERLELTSSVTIAKELTVQGFAICVSSLLLVFIQLADSFNLYSLLISSGFGIEEAKQLKGIYDRGQPIIQLGTVVATSLSLSLVPLISKAKLESDRQLLKEKIQLAFRVAIFAGAGAMVGLIAIIKPTNTMLFENAAGSNVLQILSILIFLSSIIMTASAVLQGLGFTLYPAFVILGGFIIKYCLNILFIPHAGLRGAAIASCIALLLVVIALLIKLKFQLHIKIVQLEFITPILKGAVCMYIVLKGYLLLTDFFYGIGYERIASSFQAISAVFLGGFIYLIVVLRSQVFTEEELYMLPLGSKLLLLLPKNKTRMTKK